MIKVLTTGIGDLLFSSFPGENGDNSTNNMPWTFIVLRAVFGNGTLL